MRFLVVVVLSFIAVALGQQWTLVPSTSETTLVGLGAGEIAGVCIAAAAQNGVGAVAEVDSSSSWNKVRVDAALLLDGAISSNSGVAVLASMGGVLVSTDAGKSFNAVPGTYGVSQSANLFNSGSSIGLTGTFTSNSTGTFKSSSGVAISNDKGNTWQLSGDIAYPRYGAFPSSTTWYVTAGMWGADPSSTPGESLKAKAASPQPSFMLGKRAPVHVPENVNAMKYASKPRTTVSSSATDDNTSGWFGNIYKTTDAGATWTQVFASPSDALYYFNAISCSSETLCVAVAEGDSSTGGSITLAFTTNDGGNTWTQTYSGTDYSLMAAAFVPGTQTAWIGPVTHSAKGMTGQFYQSTDGAQTWKLYQSLSGCYPFDMSFTADGTSGFAACGSSSGGSSEVATITL